MKMMQALGATALTTILAMPAQAKDGQIEWADEHDWVTVTGEVVELNDDKFRLDTGPNILTVDLNDFDPVLMRGNTLYLGDRVTVTGRLDEEFFTEDDIEATSVYLVDAQTYYFSDGDNNVVDMWDFQAPIYAERGSMITITGEVTSISGREFWIDHFGRKTEVDTVDLGYNPLDDVGAQQIDVGDRVSIRGTLDYGFFDNNELSADKVIVLTARDSQQQSRNNNQ